MKLDKLVPEKMAGDGDMAAGWNVAVDAVKAMVEAAKKFGYVLVLEGKEAAE